MSSTLAARYRALATSHWVADGETHGSFHYERRTFDTLDELADHIIARRTAAALNEGPPASPIAPPAPHAVPRCCTCAHFDTAGQPRGGICRKLPPIATNEGVGWPVVRVGDWCDAWRLRSGQ